MSIHKLDRRWRRIGSVAVAVAVGAASIASTGSAKSVARQRSLERAAIAALARPPAAHVMPAAGRVLGGFTSQNQAIVLAISKKDKQITKVGTALQMTCTLGDELLLPAIAVRVPIAPNGAVSGTATIPPSPASPGSTVSITGGSETFSGKLNAKKATFSGSWELKLGFSLSSGQTDQCDSGAVTFHAVL